MPEASRFASSADLVDEVARLREAGKVDEALALVERERAAFPDQAAYLHLWRVSLNVAAGRIDDAVRAFAEAVAAGCRYPAPMLREWPAIAALHDIVEFERLMHIAALRYDSELGASHPTLHVERPDLVAPPSGLPLLVVLHGNNSTAERTLPFWASATRHGVVLAVPGSAEIALTPGIFVWNDEARARADVLAHVERLVREQRIDPARIVLAGYSAGALRALQVAYGGVPHAHAAIAVAPWLPPAEVERLAAERPVRTFIAVGDRDGGGHTGSVALAERLRARGVPVHLEVIPGHGHAYPAAMDRLLESALQFAFGSTGSP